MGGWSGLDVGQKREDISGRGVAQQGKVQEGRERKEGHVSYFDWLTLP